ncbi:hypothetical protein GR210_31595 [Rhizobium leguminosarum]|uniref:DUF3617 family protein n=1 Tax=Rhizobium leguminosarum TaxID=384 RepID=A0A7K3VD33_RHILE|nr:MULTISPECIES: hypothetical protein [Rhizobium]MBN9981568.1 hypothetical protein [Rhizobium laguerreae]MBY3267276.1 hypothetical protein [Rhizobium laguerreae]MBY3296881.1 hypothetical protein [Rhizobium laguerreae]MBY3319470.1 hypothetical protein [Rhizobium laguerreae]MBY3356481.1 hypothetical protein [Rhizobium laguerreae]
MRTSLLSIALFTFSLSAAQAADFPLASCAGWNGTLVSRTGTDSSTAVMKGKVTQANFREYCERDPGGETTAHGGKLTVKQCVATYTKANGKDTYRSTANCIEGTLSFVPPRGEPLRVTFPLPEDADVSCASGMPPLIEQFKLLCPQAAREFHLMDDE